MAELNINDTNELIEVKNNNGELLVSARDLHYILGIGKTFGAWINEMMKYGFEENVDYNTFWSDSKNGNAVEYLGSPQKMSAKGYKKEYILKIDMAKEIAMIQRNDKGREVRKYFIECERKLKEQSLQLSERDNAILLVMNASSDIERVGALKQFEDIVTKPLIGKIEELSPLAKKFEIFLSTEGLTDISTFSKNLGIKKLGRNNMYKYLKSNNILMNNNQPYQRFIENGMFVVKPSGSHIQNGEVVQDYKTFLTAKGVNKIMDRLTKDGFIKGE